MSKHIKTLTIFKDKVNETEVGKILLEKVQLEHTIADLTREIESLSLYNSRLIDDLRCNRYFEKYNETVEKLTKLQFAYETVVNHKHNEFTNSSL